MALTPEELRHFEEKGFILKKGLIPPDWVEQIRVEIKDIHDRMAKQPAPGAGISWETFNDPSKPKRIKQLMNSELVSPTINRIIRSDWMLDIIQDLIGPDISLYHCKLLPKSAEDGTAIPWHQDYAYWKREDNRPLMVNCQFAIDPATLENGCIQFVPGSHKWGLQEHERVQQTFGVFLKGHYHPREDAVSVEMQPGDGVCFGALIIHGSAPNSSGRSRVMNTVAYNVTGNSMTQCKEILRGRRPEKA